MKPSQQQATFLVNHVTTQLSQHFNTQGLTCCVRCLLRFIGCYDWSLYAYPEERICSFLCSAEFSLSDDAKQALLAHNGHYRCFSCMGLLYDESKLIQCVSQQADTQLRTRYNIPALDSSAKPVDVDDRCKIVFSIGLYLHSDLACRDRLAQLLIKDAVLYAQNTPFHNPYFPLDREVMIDIKRCTRSVFAAYMEHNLKYAMPFYYMSRMDQDEKRRETDDMYDSFSMEIQLSLKNQDEIYQYDNDAMDIEYDSAEKSNKALVHPGSTALQQRKYRRKATRDAKAKMEKDSLFDSSAILAEKVRDWRDVSDKSIVTKLPLPIAGSQSALLRTETKITHDPLYYRGIYCKYERGLPYTPWLLDGASSILLSLEDYIAEPILKSLGGGCAQRRFASAGREDIDVRMLGAGRPFVLVIEDPRGTIFSYRDYSDFDVQQRANNLRQLEARLQSEMNGNGAENHPIGVRELKILCQNNQGNIVSLLNSGAEEKRKTYRCVVWLSKALSSADIAAIHAKHNTGDEAHDTIQIDQKTPVRVLHRRSLDTRAKYIHRIHFVEQLNEHYCTVDVVTSAGTYVKEWVHGDFGRTKPSLGDLFGCEAYILQLDVIGIEMNI